MPAYARKDSNPPQLPRALRPNPGPAGFRARTEAGPAPDVVVPLPGQLVPGYRKAAAHY